MKFFFPWSLRISAALLLPAMMAAGQNTPVQIDVSSLLNDRVVFTQQGGQLQPAQHALDAGENSALITREAVAVAQSGDLTALPWVNHRSRSWEPEPFRYVGINAGLRLAGAADLAEDRRGRETWHAAALGKLVGG